MNGKSGGPNAVPLSNASISDQRHQPMDLAQKSQISVPRGNENVKAATFVHFGNNPIIGPSASPNLCKPVASPVTVPHIPRGAAVVANMTSRSQNLPSIVRTSSLGIGAAGSASITAVPRPNIAAGQRFPMASNNWINRGSGTVPVTSKVSVTQVPGRATITTTRPSQTTMMPTTTYPPGTVKPVNSLVSGNFRSSGAVRIGPTTSEIVRHPPKGVHIAHAVQQKFIGTGGAGTVRGVSGSASVGTATLYSPTATLVTSLASSGTTITAHPANRSKNPPNSLRITSAITSSTAFSQVSPQASSVGAISLTAPSGGTILAQHSSSRNQPVEHHIPIKTPFIRAPLRGLSPNSNMKGAQALPVGTQISVSGPKVIAHPNSTGSSLALAQMANVAGHKSPGNTISPVTHAFQSRTGVVGGGTTISRIGSSAISMSKVIPQVPHRLGSPTANEAPQHSHTNVFLHRNPHPASAIVVTQSERLPTSVPQYSISATSYYVEPQNQSSFPMDASNVHKPGLQVPTTVTGGAIQAGANSPLAATSDGHSTTSMPLIKPNSSPRPTILRKRTDFDGSPLKAVKNLTTALILPISSPPSPKRPDSRGNGNASSGSTTLSANSSPEDPLLHKKGDLFEEGPAGGRLVVDSSRERHHRGGFTSYPLSIPQPMDGVSPRKKPRKQQLMGNELQEVQPCEVEFEYENAKKPRKDAPIKTGKSLTPPSMETDDDDLLYEDDFDDDEDLGDDEFEDKIKDDPQSSPSPEEDNSAFVRPHMSLLNSYRQNWKARLNHFSRHSDVKPKEDKRKNEIAPNKVTLQRVNGWKVMHISGQVDELMDLESEVGNRLKNILTAVEKRQNQRKLYKDFDKDIERLSELVKSNIQRSVTIKEQMSDAKGQMHKIFDHKENVVELLHKYSSKRTLRRKEKY